MSKHPYALVLLPRSAWCFRSVAHTEFLPWSKLIPKANICPTKRWRKVVMAGCVNWLPARSFRLHTASAECASHRPTSSTSSQNVTLFHSAWLYTFDKSSMDLPGSTSHRISWASTIRSRPDHASFCSSQASSAALNSPASASKQAGAAATGFEVSSSASASFCLRTSPLKTCSTAARRRGSAIPGRSFSTRATASSEAAGASPSSARTPWNCGRSSAIICLTASCRSSCCLVLAGACLAASFSTFSLVLPQSK
mmetsp:Transcript_50842/g.136798  ORF Transcript_50842/g.136798 Transcript_50842/m.136798 type:complete len:254 (+) Transcript_50842:329-1090(+)